MGPSEPRMGATGRRRLRIAPAASTPPCIETIGLPIAVKGIQSRMRAIVRDIPAVFMEYSDSKREPTPSLPNDSAQGNGRMGRQSVLRAKLRHVLGLFARIQTSREFGLEFTDAHISDSAQSCIA